MKYSSRPIFICGDGRSGTTLLSTILDSHEDLMVGPELHFRGPKNLGQYILECIDLLLDSVDNDLTSLKKTQDSARQGLNFIMRCHRFGVEPKELRDQILEFRQEFPNNQLESFPERCQLIDYLCTYNMKKNRAHRWGIKIMRDVKILDKYAAVWKNAFFVHIIRDGRDVAASQIKDHSGWGYNDIKTAALNWVEIIEMGRSFLKSSYKLIEIKYEDLVENPRDTLITLCDFLEIDFSDKLLSHHTVNHPLFKNHYDHPSINSVTKPINNTAVGRYKVDLSKNQIRIFNSIAEKQLLMMGYKI